MKILISIVSPKSRNRGVPEIAKPVVVPETRPRNPMSPKPLPETRVPEISANAIAKFRG